jgi:hypothetical protein
VEYQLTAEISQPADKPQLDELQQYGVAALLDEHLEALAGIEGPDGVEIEPVDHQILVQSDHATITWVLDAPALAFAEDAASHALKELLERTELLADWSVRRCEVTASDDELAAALEAGPDDEDESGLDLIVDAIGVSDDEKAARRALLLDTAGQLQALGMDAFGHQPDEADNTISEEHAQLVAGALMRGLELLTEELFADIQALEESGGSAAEQDVLWVLDELPERHADQYNALFAKKFLVTTTILGYRLSQPGWTPPLSTAEALALHLAKAKAEVQLDLASLLDEVPFADIVAAFNEAAFEDLDHEGLYQDAPDGADGLDFAEWFYPYEHLTKALHPYLTDAGLSDDESELDSAESESDSGSDSEDEPAV